jgi:hypothetical protein
MDNTREVKREGEMEGEMEGGRGREAGRDLEEGKLTATSHLRQRGLLTREDLLLCTSSCNLWRFGLLAMLPPGTPSYESLVENC